MKPKKCPCCGAPVSQLSCAYCGQVFTEEQQKQQEAETLKKDVPAETSTEVQVIKPKRTAIDKILIFIGILWLMVVIAAATSSIQHWWSAVNIVSMIIVAGPGIILLLIGFRKKKKTVVKTIRRM